MSISRRSTSKLYPSLRLHSRPGEAAYYSRCHRCDHYCEITRSCDYYLNTGERRGESPSSHCSKWKLKEKKKNPPINIFPVNRVPRGYDDFRIEDYYESEAIIER